MSTRLERRLGHDLAPHVVAQEALKKLKGEASRLRDEAMATAKETARCHGCHGNFGEVWGFWGSLVDLFSIVLTL